MIRYVILWLQVYCRAINGSSPKPLESATELGPPNTVAEEVVETVMQVDLRWS